MLCVVYLTKTGHGGRYSFGNVLIIGRVSIHYHPVIFSDVFKYKFSSPVGTSRQGATDLESICLLPNTISLVLFGFNSKKLLKHRWPILYKSSLKAGVYLKFTLVLCEISKLNYCIFHYHLLCIAFLW